MNFHVPSAAIGASVAVAAMFVAVTVAGSFNSPLNLIEDDGQPSKVSVSTLLENGSPRLGSEDAPVTIVEFGDYQCFFCNKFYHDTEKRLVEDFVQTGAASLIFKDYTIIGPDSVGAAIGARCAAEQDMFWEYHDVLYENWDGENNGWASAEHLGEFASEIGLELPAWSECVQSGRHAEALEASNADARALGITGTPAFFIIGSDGSVIPISGAQPYEVFVRAIGEQS